MSEAASFRGGARATVGGDFELAALAVREFDGRLAGRSCRGGNWSVSGRSALTIILARLKGEGVRHVHLPAYLCRSVLLPVLALGLDYSFYPVGADFAAHPEPPADCALLLIHYFGWLNPSTAELREGAKGRYHLIEDYSQAMLSGEGPYCPDGGHAFFSARKFAAVPLGGWCSEPAGEGDDPAADALAWRSLGARLAKGAYLGAGGEIDAALEDLYLGALRHVEESLDANPVGGALPGWLLQVIGAVDWDAVAAVRRANWNRMKELLGESVELPLDELPAGTVPLGFVVRVNERDRVRSALAQQRIFAPVHWPLPPEVAPARFPVAAALARHGLTIPIDQRYGEKELERVAATLKGLL